ncbi:phospholipid-translocating ATPase [Coprinopsis marcescibilis]|uniref:Phospholipid-transporting ATPase n=1 Tax=Coprinopsis marcescibilis TaxID=230819 RepID=A0A5C3LBQ6_COPMA|nr:phospholipid-translocating ATPase [Coprinopsis marcescibilis]
MKKHSKFTQLYDNWAAWKVEDLFTRKREPGPRRTVYINENLPDNYRDSRGQIKPEHVYATNQVITSKYTVLTFLPRNLLEQFRRIANIFFFSIAVLQFFPKFSTISPGLVILPLLIVLTITALKDGYEDVKRHQSDRQVNHSHVRVLSGGGWVNPNTMEGKSKTFVRGLVPKLRRKSKKVQNENPKGEELAGVATPGSPESTRELDEEEEPRTPSHHHVFPLHHDDGIEKPHWKSTTWEDLAVGDFVKIVDNESIPADVLICSTSEEENVSFVETKNLDGETNLKSRNAVAALTHIRSAADCASSHNSFRIDCDRPEINMYRLNAAVRVGQETIGVDIQNVLLRGTVLRNTKWVIGVVIYTGQDTRIVMNSGGTPSKRSKVERQMNPQVFINLMVLAVMAVVCAIVDSILQHRYYPEAPWLYGANLPTDNPSINGLITFFFALITFQNIVPISLYISIEFVRTAQAAFIYFDKQIYYEKTDKPTIARSWNLSDDLGQIEYIFSDKTGTLTQNQMVFRSCSIGGRMYAGDPSMEDEIDAGSKLSGDIKELPEVSKPPASGESGASSSTAPSDTKLAADEKAVPSALEGTATKPRAHFHDAELASDLQEAVSAEPGTIEAAHARQLNGFFSVLALCHTVLTNVDPHTGVIDYKAQSPDEAALVQAAADMGFVFRGRDKETLLLQTPFSGIKSEMDEASSSSSSRPVSREKQPESAEGLERYELLNILEFTSARKRMSVIVRKMDGDDGRLFLLSKGADNVIFERLKQGYGEELKADTERHLDEFASQGLRTLTLAYKVVPEQEYQAWAERYHQATVSLDDREEKIEAVCDEIEQNLRLLGATAIEDKLQDGVPETIADLKKAGIKIWVATGDKLETAIAIGHSTNLIGPDSNIIVIRGGSGGRPVYDQIKHAVEEFFPGSNIIDEDGEARDVEESMPPKSPKSVRGQSFADGGPLQRVDTGISSIVGSANGDRPGGFVLVIDGSALTFALGDDRHKNILLQLAMLCEGVICCRVSPIQKAMIVRLVKDGLGAMTLAIGDGANDVSMIQAADVGIGISGEEGLQAVNSSDYAIAQFRFLKRLLLVHGHWSYYRNGNMILNFFYKNIVCIGVLWWFQIYCAWSSNYVLEYTYLLFWNSFWTLAPVIAIGLFDRVADDVILMDFPELYRFGREGRWFGMRLFTWYMSDGVVQSAIIFFIILYSYMFVSARNDGWQVSLYEFSTPMAFAAAFTANFFNGLNTNTWTGWVFFAVFFGDVFIWLYTVVYNSISPGWFVTPVYGNNVILFRSAFFWLSLPITILLCLLPRYVYKAYKACYYPDDIDIIRHVRKLDPKADLRYAMEEQTQQAHALAPLRRPASVASRTTSRAESIATLPGRPSVDLRSASRTDMSTGVTSQYRGFDFSMEEGGVAIQRMQTNLSERRQSRTQLPAPESPNKRRKLTLPRSFLRLKGSNIRDSSQS